METFAFVSAVRGYHVYQDIFTPSIGEKLVAKLELNNTMDKQVVTCFSVTMSGITISGNLWEIILLYLKKG